MAMSLNNSITKQSYHLNGKRVLKSSMNNSNYAGEPLLVQIHGRFSLAVDFH